MEKYQKLETDIRSQSKTDIKEIAEEQRLLEQGRKESKEDFL